MIATLTLSIDGRHCIVPPLVRRRLCQAGLRLAMVLNEAHGDK
jgi:hypothetical protein